MKNKFDSEADMLAKLIADLEAAGFEIYKEVEVRGGSIDIVAVKQMANFKLYWGIEGKMSATEAVCLQAESRLPFVHGVSIATPVDPNIMTTEWLKNRNIGILQIFPDDISSNIITSEQGYFYQNKRRIYISEHSSIIDVNRRLGGEETDKPTIGEHSVEISKPKFKKPKKLAYISELNKQTIAGGCGGQATVFKQTMFKVFNYLKENGPKTLKEIVKNVEHHYSSDAVARAQLRKAMCDWQKDQYLQIEEDGDFKYKVIDKDLKI
jgi:hypothetical protein